MKRVHLLIALPMIIAATTHGALAADGDCGALQSNIERQIEIAKTNESDNEAIGYQQALDALKADCNAAAPIKQSQQEIAQLQRQISQTQSDAAQAEVNLSEALNENDEEKIAQFEENVGEKQQELLEQQDALEIAQARLQALSDRMPQNN